LYDLFSIDGEAVAAILALKRNDPFRRRIPKDHMASIELSKIALAT